jgi:F-type H+-transporting ATPase subunit delta
VNLSSIARRYAKALFELSAEEGRVDEVAGQLRLVRTAIEVPLPVGPLEADERLLRDLSNPSATREERQALAEKLVDTLKAGPTLGNALRLMADRGRLGALPAVERIFRDLADERAGRIRARVVTATPLSDDLATHLTSALARATRLDVVLERTVDRSIIGGAMTQVGSQLYDGSLRNQIAQLKRQLKA